MSPHIFAEDKKRYYCRDLVLGCMGSIARLSSTIGKQDYHQNFGKYLTYLYIVLYLKTQ